MKIAGVLTFLGERQHYPGGIKAIGRGLSETTPTEQVKNGLLTPKVVTARVASTPFGVAEDGAIVTGGVHCV